MDVDSRRSTTVEKSEKSEKNVRECLTSKGEGRGAKSYTVRLQGVLSQTARVLSKTADLQ
jgi:hypothetical protein